ncbi:ABC transporter ATP-binding protein/permease [Lapidilactobacillus bayanensis]|uniref:ABC transporter ATP-binding protein/permease n=1 Tax=Lapidilactobacillus bayanensis TaxID=2485998 RepID=UPI0013DDE037|nr:ATP-binding cassette domain-containing protein [Lapidilactobacillus bayanensis]
MSKLVINSLDIKFEKEILKRVSYEFDSGKVYLIKGESGIGKSSLLNVLGLLRRPSAGQVYFNDVNLWDLNDSDRANFRIKNFGFIFQEHNLVKQLSLEQNITIPLLKTTLSVQDRRRIVDNTINSLNLSGKQKVNSNQLSGGEDQRGAIARALVTDAEVLFADEPTNSLDHNNAVQLYEKLQSLAHEQNKIVIIVSHEELPVAYADVVLSINNTKLIGISNRSVDLAKTNQVELKTNKPNFVTRLDFNSALQYNKINQQTRRQIPMLILIVIIALLSVSSLILTMPKILASQQEASLNSATDNSIFITNDTIKSKSGQDLDPMRDFTTKEISEIKHLPDVISLNKYFTFVSYGLTKNNVRSAVPNSTSIRVQNKRYTISKTFSIQPIYKSDLIKKYLYTLGQAKKEGHNFVVSQSFLADNKIPIHNIVGKTLRLQIYVPYAQYISTSELPNNNKKIVKTDGNIYTQILLARKVTGVYADNYPYNRSENSNALFLDYVTMNKMLQDAIKENIQKKRIFPEFKQRGFGVSALVVQAKNFNNMTSLTHAVQSMSPIYNVSSIAQNVDSLNDSVKKTQKSVTNMALMIIVGTIATLTITFFLTNKNRFVEIGILKAIGFTTADIRRILLINGIRYSVILFVCSEILDVISMLFINNVVPIDLIKVLLSAFVTNVFLSFGIVLIASLLPIHNLSHIDPLEIIKKH